jgi:glycosyltransferase involved in cell wall biosynthesis
MMKTFLVDNFTLDPNLIEKVSPGVDLHAYNPGSISMERIKDISDKWRIPEDSPMLFLPLDIEHGHFVFLHALHKLPDKDFYAVIISKGKKADRDILEKYVMDLGLSGKVIIPTVCEDWGAAFWLSSLLVVPNMAPMGQNLEVLQAQALGRAVIITSVGANEEMVCKESTAWVVSADNVNALAKAIDDALSMDREQMIVLADNARFFIEENFPQSVWINKMLKLYEKVINS